MPYKLSFDMPNLTEGTEVQIIGLGVFENGKAYKVSDEQADFFQRTNAMPGANPGDPDRLGPDLMEANFPEGVTAEELQETKESPEEGDS